MNNEALSRGAYVDDDETLGVSNFVFTADIVSALKEFGISCKDNNGNWKELKDILQEVANQWNDMTNLFKEE